MGVCLLVVRRTFGDRIPTLQDYCASQGVSDDTIRRAARALLRPVVRLLSNRRPGPKPAKKAPVALQALQAVNGLLRTLLPDSVPRLLKSAVTRALVVHQVELWRKKGVSLQEMAAALGMSDRTLSRWTTRLEKEGGGVEVPEHSRRPHTSPHQVPEEIQEALRRLGRLFPKRSAAELTRVFHQHFQVLLEVHGLRELSEKTAGKNLRGERSKATAKPESSQRGTYTYPPPLTMAWIDTTHFEVAGVKVHIVVALEAFSRMALGGEACVQENSEVVAGVLSETLRRVPGLAALVRDRGTPYLNRQIDDLLADRGCLPIDAHPHFPIDKAALERFFGTLKPWLRAALARLEEEWREATENVSREVVLAAVRAVFQLFLRAYNLIPQPYLEARCPFERLEAALKEAGATAADLDRLHRLAREREDKDALLVEIRDGLQIDLPLKRIRRDFAHVDKQALRAAYHACFEKLVLRRDATIRKPYAYLRAVALRKHRAFQEDREWARREAIDHHARLVQDKADEDLIRREREDRATNPERHLVTNLETWLRLQTMLGPPGHTLGTTRLRETLAATARKLGDAFQPFLDGLCDTIPRLLTHLRPGSELDSASLIQVFRGLARPVVPLTPPSPEQSGDLARPSSDGASSTHISNLVRQVLDELPVPHDRRTDVSP